MSKSALKPGVGLDVGTMNLVAARSTTEGKSNINPIRDAFLDVESEHKQVLKMAKVNFVEAAGRLIVLGDDALKMANLLKREARRPLSKGVIAAGELDAQEILSYLVHRVVGPVVEPGEHCFYSVPAEPVDVLFQEIGYHREVFRKILTGYGYEAHPANEAMAIIFSQCAKENFSGLALSFGAGMTNVALAYQAISGMEFSVARSGDWVDSQSARAVGKTASQMCAIKERGVNLAKPANREQEALALYLKALIEYALKNISAQFKAVQGQVDLPEPIPLIVSGGTSKAGGFMDIFREVFAEIQEAGFPIQISEVRAADDPLSAVAQGLLILAEAEYEEDE